MAVISYDPDFAVEYVPLCDRENIDKDDVCIIKLKPSTQGNTDLIRKRALLKSRNVKGLKNGEIDDAILSDEMKKLFIANVVEIKNYSVESSSGETRAVTESDDLYNVADPTFIVDILNAIQKKSVLDEGQKKTLKAQ